MFMNGRSSALQLGLWACAALSPGVVSAETIFGCSNKTNGNVRIVAEGVRCLNSELPVSWSMEGAQGPAGPEGPAGPTGPTGPAGPGVKTISGIVSGTTGQPLIVTPNGFTSERLDVGLYKVTLPPGSFTRFPVAIVSTNGASGGPPPFAMARIEGATFSPVNGSATFNVGISSTMPDITRVDESFHFIAAESLPPAP